MRKALFALATLAPLTAHAGGVFVGEPGSQAMERGGAFVAKADDPTALSINPAGLAKLKRAQIYLGATLLDYSLTFKRSGVYPSQLRTPQPSYVGSEYPEVENGAGFQPIPYLAGGGTIGNLAIAGGLWAPPAVPGRDFDCTVSDELCQIDASGAPAPQRYDIVEQKSLIAYPSLALAYRVHERVDIGARFSWGFGTVDARNFPWALPNNPEDPLREGDFDASVKDLFMPTFGVGVLIRPIDSLEFGAAYGSKTQLRGHGTGNAKLGMEAGAPGINDPQLVPKDDDAALCETGGTVTALKTCIDFDLPQNVNVGLRWIFGDGRGGERGDIEVDGKWENWADASDDVITVDGQDRDTHLKLNPVTSRHGFDDVWAVRVGGSYKIDVGASALSVRAGAGYDTAAAPVSWTRADKDGRARTTLAAGAAYEIRNWRFDAGLAVVLEGTQDVANVTLSDTSYANRVQPDPLQPSIPPSLPSAYVYHPINAGRYDSGYVVGLLGVTAMF